MMKNEYSVPWNIKFIGFIFVFFGTLGLTDVISVFAEGIGGVSLALLLIPLGIFLCMRYPAAGPWTKLVSWTLILLAAVNLFFGILIGSSPVRFDIKGNVIALPGWPVFFLLCPILILFGCWVIRSVNQFYSRSPDQQQEQPDEDSEKNVQDTVSNGEDENGAHHARRAFSPVPLTGGSKEYLRGGAVMGCLISLVWLLAFISVSVPVDKSGPSLVVTQTKNKTVFDHVYYGERFGELAYVVFYRGTIDNPPIDPVDRMYSNDGHVIGMRVINQKTDFKRRFFLPGDHLIYQIRDGKIETADLQVHTSLLEKYIESSPDSFGIDTLRNFLDDSSAED